MLATSFHPGRSDWNFNTQDLDALRQFSDTDWQFIMDGLAFRGHGSAVEIGLSQNEVFNLRSWEVESLLEPMTVGPGDTSKQHVNQVVQAFNFDCLAMAFIILRRWTFMREGAYSPRRIQSPSSTSGLPAATRNCRMANSQMDAFSPRRYLLLPPYRSTAYPNLDDAVFNGTTYTSVNHLVTTTIPNAGIDPIPEPNPPGWTIYLTPE